VFLMQTALGATALAATGKGDEALLLNAEQPIIPAPKDPTLWPAFRRALDGWREWARRHTRYDDAMYSRPVFSWAASSFACGFMMLCDERVYDRHRRRYTVDAFLDSGLKEFGGYDSLVLWHAYPRIGVDERNQFDFYRDLPGGLNGLRAVIGQIQGRGVRVYVDYNPWDISTRR
jgi:hypothetical protein